MEFIAFVDSGYVEEARKVWEDHDDIARRLSADEALTLYEALRLFDEEGTLAEAFYDGVTKLENKAARELVIRRRFGSKFEAGR